MIQKTLLFISIFSISHLYGLDLTLLTHQKQEIFKKKKEIIEASAKQLKYNWISPLHLSSSLNQSNSNSGLGYNASIQLNQDIYRSGGIGHALSYADAQLAYNLLSLEMENAQLYQELFVGLLTLQRLKVELEQAEYQLKNSEIAIFLKTQQYKTGAVDITELNNALMSKNSTLKTLLTTKKTILSQQIALRQLTDTPLEQIKIMPFKSLAYETYIQSNFNFLQAMFNSQLTDTEYEIQKTNYLPKVSVSGQYGYQDRTTNYTQDNTFHSVGLTLSMPLDYNEKASLEENYASFLKSKLDIGDIKADEEAFYKQGQTAIANYQEYIEVTQKNMALYKELIDVSDQGFKAGYRTGYDLQTLKNTKIIDELEIKINKINIQIEEAKLHFASNLGEKYYEKQQ
jgi:outer membrane protein TolC